MYYTQLQTTRKYHILIVTRFQGSVSLAGTYVVCSLREDTLWWGTNKHLVHRNYRRSFNIVVLFKVFFFWKYNSEFLKGRIDTHKAFEII